MRLMHGIRGQMKIQITLESGEVITSNEIADDNPAGDHPMKKLRKCETLCKKINKLSDVKKADAIL